MYPDEALLFWLEGLMCGRAYKNMHKLKCCRECFCQIHAGVLRVHSLKQVGHHYIRVMIVVKQNNPTKSTPPSHKIKLAADVAAGLAKLHSHEPPIVHRDVKADNVSFLVGGHTSGLDALSHVFMQIHI